MSSPEVTKASRMSVEETKSKSTRRSKKRRIVDELTPELRIKIQQKMPELLSFVARLETIISHQRKKLRKYRSLVQPKKSKSTVSTQTEEQTIVKSIAEEITEAAQQAVQTTGFVYEETSGMYYDYSSGYYYNAEYGLYYDGNTGTYMKYDPDTKEYKFHSQVALPDKVDRSKKVKKKKKVKKQENTKGAADEVREKNDDIEEGECSAASASSTEEEDGLSDTSQKNDYEISDIAKQYPPCMRVIVQETDISELRVGSLFMITYDGGSIGREGSHAILLPDLILSKQHCKVFYDHKEKCYNIVDLGSRNGTFLNGERISVSKSESDPHQVPHGSRLKVGSTLLLCHIHDGLQTCAYCEPGLLMSKEANYHRYDKAESHKTELENLRKKFGFRKEDEEVKAQIVGYTDRAKERRKVIGSQNPYEKTLVVSVEDKINKSNKGYKLLQKMGWKKGDTLGVSNNGIAEPIQVVANPGYRGLGSTTSVQEQLVPRKRVNKKEKKWVQVQERFNKLSNECDIFEENAET